MLKNVTVLLTASTLFFYSIYGFAISPGAGQAQIRNHLNSIEQNKKFTREVQKKYPTKQNQKQKNSNQDSEDNDRSN